MLLALVCCCFVESQNAEKFLSAAAGGCAEQSLCRSSLMEECTSHGQHHSTTSALCLYIACNMKCADTRCSCSALCSDALYCCLGADSMSSSTMVRMQIDNSTISPDASLMVPLSHALVLVLSAVRLCAPGRSNVPGAANGRQPTSSSATAPAAHAALLLN